MRATVYLENSRIMSRYLQRLQPVAVEADFGFLRIEDLEDLRLIGLGVLLDGLAGHGRARDVAARGIADHGRSCRRSGR